MRAVHQPGLQPSGPRPPEPLWPRYSVQPFPAYRFVPGLAPHPRRHPGGHSYGRDEWGAALCAPERWDKSEVYRFGVDLYNFAYWWECHEVFEAFWHAAGRQTERGRFFQGLIHVAAVNLKLFMGNGPAARRLSEAAWRHLHDVPPRYMGVDVMRLTQEVYQYVDGVRAKPALIRLQLADEGVHAQ